MRRYAEQAVAIGPCTSLIGILTRSTGPAESDRPAIVILNTGIIHRVGHNRMYVALSRLLAEAGHTVLRFDLSGLGDSARRSDGLHPMEAALADIRDAIDWLTADDPHRRVILMGLCSGADHAIVYSRTDPRIVGLVLIDPSVPRTSRYYLVAARRWLIRARRSPVAWHQLKQRLTKWANGDDRSLRPPGNRQVREFLDGAYRESAKRGVRFLAMFTRGAWGGDNSRPYEHNYGNQLLEAFPTLPFGEQLEIEHFPAADHVFTTESDRGQLFRATLDWLERTAFTRAPTVPRNCARTLACIMTAGAACLT